jgi:formylmethanofuran dehydrogenase subunit E
VDAPDREELLKNCLDFHGHFCLGQILGIRIALKGMELIGTRDPMKMIVLIENDRCIADAIQVVTGTRIGRRSAKLVEYGKMAATFVNTEEDISYRVNIRHVDPSKGRNKEAYRHFLNVPDSEMLAWRRVSVSLKPEELPGRPKLLANCDRCGEKIFDGKDVHVNGATLCRSCANGAYYEVVEDTDEA